MVRDGEETRAGGLKGAKWRWMVVPVTRSHVETEGFGKRNRFGLARLNGLSPLSPYMSRFSLFLSFFPHVAAIYCSHSAGSQHKYVTPMAAPIAPSSRIPSLSAEFERRKNVRKRGEQMDWCVLRINWLVCHAGRCARTYFEVR